VHTSSRSGAVDHNIEMTTFTPLPSTVTIERGPIVTTAIMSVAAAAGSGDGHRPSSTPLKLNALLTLRADTAWTYGRQCSIVNRILRLFIPPLDILSLAGGFLGFNFNLNFNFNGHS
jgi:hypothetical protein